MFKRIEINGNIREYLYMLNVYYIIYVKFCAGARPCDTLQHGQ